MQFRHPRLVIRVVCAVALLASFFLPMAQGCSSVELFPRKDTGAPGSGGALLTLEIEDPGRRYAHDIVRDEQTGIVAAALFVLFGFLWPWPILVAWRAVERDPLKILLAFAELTLCICTAVLLLITIAFGGALMIGGYMAFSAVAIYCGISLYDLFRELRRAMAARSGRGAG